MSQVSNAVLEIQAMAHDMGDDFGFDPETAVDIANAMGFPLEFVQQALEAESNEAFLSYDE